MNAEAGYIGCHHDCSTNTDGHGADRVCDDIVGDVTNIADCRAKCTGYNYMGLACPRNNAFECWCCNELDPIASGASALVSSSDCDNSYLHSGINNNRNDHCSGFGPADGGGYKLDGFSLGGHCRAAIYTPDADPTVSDAMPDLAFGLSTNTCHCWLRYVGRQFQCDPKGHPPVAPSSRPDRAPT